MAIYEARARRNGTEVPIECLLQEFEAQPVPSTVSYYHYHDYVELLYGTRGTASVYIAGRTYSLKKGDLVVVHTREPHNVLGTRESCAYIVIKFLPQVLLSGEQTSTEYTYALLLMRNNGREFFSAAELKSAGLSTLFWRAMTEWDEQLFGYELGIRAAVTNIYLFVLRKWKEDNLTLFESGMMSEQGAVMQKAVAMMNSEYRDLTEADCAARCGLSYSYFSRTFKHLMDKSFSTYLNGIRLQEAERMLLTSGKSVTEIAQETGFSTTSYFISLFGQKHGITPLQYRVTYNKKV